jgi:hypothetical protein
MTDSARPATLFTQVDITAGAPPQPAVTGTAIEQSQLLRDISNALDRQNELLEELVAQVGSVQRQRANELAQWKEAHPRLAKSCRAASEAMTKVQNEFLAALTSEINENPEALLEGEFMLNEFIDRYGPRLAHLNSVLQVLGQLGSMPSAANPS